MAKLMTQQLLKMKSLTQPNHLRTFTCISHNILNKNQYLTENKTNHEIKTIRNYTMTKINKKVLEPRKNINTSSESFCSQVLPEFTINRLSGEDEGICVFELNRPHVKNALNRNIVNQFHEGLLATMHDKGVRVLVIRSLVPGAFSVGGDLKERVKMKPEEVGPFLTKANSLLRMIEELPVPVIFAIDGLALGGGLEMALAGDMIVVSESAKLGLTETKLAIIPGGGGTQRLPRLIGVNKAKELIYTGAMISGVEAETLGLANYCVSQTEAGDAAYVKSLEIARKIIPNGPLGVKMAKNAINNGIQVDISTGLSIERACYAQVIPTKDRMEALKAFKEKRKPVYKGE